MQKILDPTMLDDKIKKYSNSISLLSFFSICMVAYIHSQCYNPLIVEGNPDSDKYILRFIQLFISEGVCKIAVPVFFFISGQFFIIGYDKTKTWHLNKIRRRTYTLMVPYIFWCFMNFLIFFIAQEIKLTRNFFTREIISDMSFLGILDKLLWHPYCAQMWFVRDLYLLIWFSPIILYLIWGQFRSFLAITFLIWFFTERGDLPGAIEGLLFFSLGCVYNLKSICLKMSNQNLLVLGLLWFLLLIIRSTGVLVLNCNLVWVLKLSILLGCTVAWNLKDIVANKLANINWMFTYTFFIYVFHYPLMAVINKLYLSIGKQDELSRILLYLINPILVILFCIAVAAAMKKCVPIIYGHITGGR